MIHNIKNETNDFYLVLFDDGTLSYHIEPLAIPDYLPQTLYIQHIHQIYMVQAMVNISEEANRVLNIVKAQYGLKDKSEAINVVAGVYGKQLLEPELRPEYVKKLKRIEKEKGIPFRNIAELRKIIGG